MDILHERLDAEWSRLREELRKTEEECEKTEEEMFKLKVKDYPSGKLEETLERFLELSDRVDECRFAMTKFCKTHIVNGKIVG